MKVGLVCPYSFDVPGGVQFHVRDLAEELLSMGHEVSVLAPADDGTPLPDFVTSAGGSVPVHYNGSVARLSFGPIVNARVRRWIAEGGFDVLHIHEPVTPSVGMLALWAASGPVAATFHSSQESSLALHLAEPLVRSAVEKIAGRIAVSNDARRTLIEHLGGDAIVIPNGVYVDAFASARAQDQWRGTPEAPTIAFLGRADEPRKGLPVLLGAIPRVLSVYPGARFLIAGRGEVETQIAELGEAARAVTVLGPISDHDKEQLLASVDVFVAPQTGGESFGIVLVEAMSAGAAVVASDLASFADVLDDGALGRLFPVGDSLGAAEAILDALTDTPGTERMRAAARRAVARYDWGQVAKRIVAVYEMIAPSAEPPVTTGAQARVARRQARRRNGNGNGGQTATIGDDRRGRAQ